MVILDPGLLQCLLLPVDRKFFNVFVFYSNSLTLNSYFSKHGSNSDDEGQAFYIGGAEHGGGGQQVEFTFNSLLIFASNRYSAHLELIMRSLLSRAYSGLPGKEVQKLSTELVLPISILIRDHSLFLVLGIGKSSSQRFADH